MHTEIWSSQLCSEAAGGEGVRRKEEETIETLTWRIRSIFPYIYIYTFMSRRVHMYSYMVQFQYVCQLPSATVYIYIIYITFIIPKIFLYICIWYGMFPGILFNLIPPASTEKVNGKER